MRYKKFYIHFPRKITSKRCHLSEKFFILIENVTLLIERVKPFESVYDKELILRAFYPSRPLQSSSYCHISCDQSQQQQQLDSSLR